LGAKTLDELLGVAARTVAFALEAGATEADATVTTAQRFSTEARAATVAKLEQSTAHALTVRAFVDGAKATLSTTDLSTDSVRALVREIVESARFVERDPLAGIPLTVEQPTPGDALEIYFAEVAARDPAQKIADAQAMEAATRAYDARIDNSSGSRVSDASITVALANSNGFAGAYRATSVLRATSPIARDGANRRNASYGSAARGYADLESVESIAREAARRAVEMCGARKPGTMRLPVIFERDVAAAVLGDVFGALSAANVANGNSFLVGRIGDRIGSDHVTILDDGLLRRGLGTSPFDAEGTPTRTTTVFERGVLRTYLYDTYYGRKLGSASTGNAAGGSIGPNNFYLAPGTGTFDELIASTARGILVLDTIGFSTESVTGTYSRGARGMMIENGEPTYAIDEFTIAGHLPTMLAAIDAVASDLRFDGAIVSPSFRVAEMTVSGQ
jgi:PmbA protein